MLKIFVGKHFNWWSFRYKLFSPKYTFVSSIFTCFANTFPEHMYNVNISFGYLPLVIPKSLKCLGLWVCFIHLSFNNWRTFELKCFNISAHKKLKYCNMHQTKINEISSKIILKVTVTQFISYLTWIVDKLCGRSVMIWLSRSASLVLTTEWTPFTAPDKQLWWINCTLEWLHISVCLFTKHCFHLVRKDYLAVFAVELLCGM